jgi:hypothetical protein
MFIRLNIKKCDSAMDEDLNPNVKVRGSSFYSYNLWYLTPNLG